MQSARTEAEERRQRLEERAAQHAQWKRSFFLARPAPRPRLTRRRAPREPTGPPPASAALLRHARDIARRHYAADRASPAAAPAAALPLSPAAERQREWVAAMLAERARRRPGPSPGSPASDPQTTVVLAGLHADTTEAELRAFADQFGHVVSLRLVRDARTGASRRYAFAEFRLRGEARKATRHSRQKRLRGRAVIIDVERGRTDPAFLPQRLAAAVQVNQELQELQEQQRQRGGARDGTAPSADTSCKGTASGSAEPADEDAAFLAAVLNGEL